MKILYITFSNFPSKNPDSVQVLEFSTALERIGHEVTVVGRTRQPKKDDQDILGNYGISESLDLIRVPYLKFFHKHRFYRQAINVLSSYSPDLVYSRSLIPLTLSLSRGYHGIYEAHTVPQRWLYEQILRFTTRLESYRGTVFISEPLREKFLNQGIHPRETPSLVAPDGVNLDKFQHPDTVPNDHHRLDLEKRIALYCGSLLPGRGIEEVLLPVMEQVDGWELVLVGGKTEQVERLKSHVRESDSVMVLGHRPHREIPWFLQQADALLMPYQESVSIRDHDETTEEYMSPLKLFEYLAAGKPILSSDLPVLRQVLSHEENALLLPPDQPAEWAGALTRIQRDDDLSKQLSRNAYRDAERYSWTNRARSVMSKFFSS